MRYVGDRLSSLPHSVYSWLQGAYPPYCVGCRIRRELHAGTSRPSEIPEVVPADIVSVKHKYDKTVNHIVAGYIYTSPSKGMIRADAVSPFSSS